MKSLLTTALLALSLLFSLPSFAQLTDSTTTNSRIIHDKLTLQIYTSNVVAKGQLQLDIDYSLEQFSHPYGWRMTSGSLPEVKARYGLFKNVEARVATRIGYFSDNRSDGIKNFYNKTAYIDFLTLGLKATIHRYNNQKGNLAVIAESNVPLLRFLHSGPSYRFIPALTIINENQINSWLGYTLNAGASYYVWERELYRLQLAAAAHFYHNPNTISFIGFSNIGNPFYTSFSDFSLNTGFIYTASPYLQVRTGFNLSLTGNTTHVADLGGTIGLAWQPDFFKKK